MKLLVAADLHLTHKTPFGRKDNYAETCLGKLEQLVDYANVDETDIIITGDMFDQPNNTIWFVNRVIAVLKECKSTIYAIAGNHDLKYHVLDNLKESSLWNLLLARVITLSVPESEWIGNNVYANFCNYGEEWFAAPTPVEGVKNLLILHTPVFGEVPFYMPNADTPESLEKKYPGYDYYLVGDIHQSLITDKVINPGSMMRMTRAQKEHKPCFVELDTDTGEKTIHYFQIEEDVWKTDFVAEVEDGFSEGLQELSEVLVARGEKLSYKDTVTTLAGNEEIKLKFMKIMEGYKNENS